MFKFCNLYSGSTGNVSLLITDNAKILIDAGESAKKIEEALKEFNIKVEDLDGILITHEHTDHTKALPILSSKYEVPIYANKETLSAFKELTKKELKNEKIYKVEKEFSIKDINIKAFNVPHDAANPCGFSIFYKNKKISIATDLGHIDKKVFENLKNSEFLMIESNYDLNILKCSKYPYYLKERISGPLGHLSNDNTGELITKLVGLGLERVELAHLSKENNFPELAYKTVVEKLIENKVSTDNIKIDIASNKLDKKIIDLE